jgi:uncharacterized protein YjbK
MSNAIEIEAKALVKKDDYEKLANLFKDYPSFCQTNYYIDNEERLLHKEGIVLRVREKKGIFEMTLKTPLSEGLLEKSELLSEGSALALKERNVFPENDLKRFLTMLDIDISSLKILTSLKTERIDAPYQGGKLSIDKNDYSGLEDYEIELEYNNQADAERLLKELLESNGIAFSLNKKTKMARAMENRK